MDVAFEQAVFQDMLVKTAVVQNEVDVRGN
jgi:hypothetical protein